MIQKQAYNTLQNSAFFQSSLWTEAKAKLMNRLGVKTFPTTSEKDLKATVKVQNTHGVLGEKWNTWNSTSVIIRILGKYLKF